MKNRKNIHKAWKVGLLGVTACFVLGGCSISKAADEEQSDNNAVIATSIAAEEKTDLTNAGNSTDAEKEDTEKLENEKTTTTASTGNTVNTTSSAGKIVETTTGTTSSTTISTTTSATSSADTVSGRSIGGEVTEHVTMDQSQTSFLPMINLSAWSDPVYKGNTADDRMILMDIRYPFLTDYSDNSGSTLYTILEQVNKKCKAEADRYRTDYEGMARDEYTQKTDWEDDTYFYYSSGYLRRVDEKVFSMVEFIESYAHGAHPCYNYYAHNYDVTTGKEITLDYLVSDKESLYNALKKALTEKYDANVFLEEDTLTTTLHDYVYDPSGEGMLFSIEKDGVSFWFGNYELAAFSEGCQMVTIPFKGNESLFNKEYVTTQEDYVKMVVPGVEYKLSSGHTLAINDGHDENGYVDLDIVYDNKSNKVDAFKAYDTQKTYLVHKNGKDYLYCQANGLSDDDILVIYNLGEGQLGTDQSPAENVKLLCDMIDPDHIRMYLRIDVLSTIYIEKIFHIGNDGKPVSDSDYYELGDNGQELTLIKDLKAEVAANENADLYTEEVLPQGTKMKIFRTNGKNLIDLKLQDGRIVRLPFETDEYTEVIPGIDVYEYFSGMTYSD